MQEPATRARQHLLIQGFTLYTCEAAAALLFAGSPTLTDPEHAWAVEFDANSQSYTAMIVGDGQLAAQLRQGALVASAGQLHVLTHTQGGMLLVPLEVSEVRDARMRIEGAVALGKTPPVERLQAFGDDALLAEATKRGLVQRQA